MAEVEEIFVDIPEVKYKPYVEDIGFTIIKQKIEFDRYLKNLYGKEDQKQFDFLKEINPHIHEYAQPGDMCILMNRPPLELSSEAKQDLKEAQQDAMEVVKTRNTLPQTNEEADMKVSLAAIDNSCLVEDNHVTQCVDSQYGDFESVKMASQEKQASAQDIMNFFQVILEKGCTDDPTNCMTTGVGAYLAASDPLGGDTKDMDKLKGLMDEFQELSEENAKKMNEAKTQVERNNQRNDFIKKRKKILDQLKSKVNKNMMKAINIPTDGKLKTNLGISTKANIYQARGDKKIVAIKGNYASQYKYVVKLSKGLKLGGYVAAVIGTAQTMYQAYAICNMKATHPIAQKHNLSAQDLDEACEYQLGQSIAKSTGLVAGGMAGGAVATYLICNAVFGLETGGTSLFWCALVVGGVGAAAGSYYGADVMSWGLDKIEEDISNNEIYIKGKLSAIKINGEEALYQ